MLTANECESERLLVGAQAFRNLQRCALPKCEQVLDDAAKLQRPRPRSAALRAAKADAEKCALLQVLRKRKAVAKPKGRQKPSQRLALSGKRDSGAWQGES